MVNVLDKGVCRVVEMFMCSVFKEVAWSINVFRKIFYVSPLLFVAVAQGGTIFSSPDVTVHDKLANLFPSKTVYFGVNMGGGSTEWKYLVDTMDPDGDNTETPSAVKEGGPSWGVVFG